jgi:hypothetical protein
MNISPATASPLMTPEGRAFLAATKSSSPEQLQKEAMLAAKLGAITSTGRPLSFADALAIKQMADLISKSQPKPPQGGNALQDYVNQKIHGGLGQYQGLPPNVGPVQPPPPLQGQPQPPQQDPRLAGGVGAMSAPGVGMAGGGIVAFTPGNEGNDGQLVNAYPFGPQHTAEDPSGMGAPPPHVATPDYDIIPASVKEQLDIMGTPGVNESQFGHDWRAAAAREEAYKLRKAKESENAQSKLAEIEKAKKELDAATTQLGLFGGYFNAAKPEVKAAAQTRYVRAKQKYDTLVKSAQTDMSVPSIIPTAAAATIGKGTINTPTSSAAPPAAAAQPTGGGIATPTGATPAPAGATPAPTGATGSTAAPLPPDFVKSLNDIRTRGIASVSSKGYGGYTGNGKLPAEWQKSLDDMKAAIPADIDVKTLAQSYLDTLGENEGLKKFKQDIENYRTKGNEYFDKTATKIADKLGWAAMGEYASQTGMGGTEFNKFLGSLIVGKKAALQNMAGIEKEKLAFMKDVSQMGYEAAKTERDERKDMLMAAARESGATKREIANLTSSLANATASAWRDITRMGHETSMHAADLKANSGIAGFQQRMLSLSDLEASLNPNDPAYEAKKQEIDRQRAIYTGGYGATSALDPRTVSRVDPKALDDNAKAITVIESQIRGADAVIDNGSMSEDQKAVARKRKADLVAEKNRLAAERNAILQGVGGIAGLPGASPTPSVPPLKVTREP